MKYLFIMCCVTSTKEYSKIKTICMAAKGYNIPSVIEQYTVNK